jgi:hypothetical protein
MPRKHIEESIQDIKPLLAQGSEIASNATELSCPRFRAEAAGDFLLEFHHAQIPFGLIVIEGEGEIMHKAKHRSLMGV